MGAACQKQFSNIPEQFPQQYEQEKERISTSSIKLQHKNFRPNSKTVSMGMIDSIIQSQLNRNLNRTGTDGLNSPSKTKVSAIELNEKMKHSTRVRELDLQELHATQRPFEGAEIIALGVSDALVPKDEHKNRQLLDFTFYHSLGLEEYNYRPFPPDLARQYENLPVCEQEIRNGVKYIGEWKSDLKAAHGNGVMQSNTTKYIGQFKNGLKHFHGREIEKNQVYEGQFENGRRKGKGNRYFPDGEEEGIYDEYLIQGKITYHNQNTYEGELLKNRYHGEGVFFNKKANLTQSGTFRNGRLHGYGTIKQWGQLVYEGHFQEDLKHGKGAYYWSRENYYIGNYAKDKKHGYGELRKGNIIYKGMFNNGHMDGPIDIYELIEDRQFKKTTLNFRNGLREYADEESSTFSDDGLPREWRDALTRKKQADYSQGLDNKSSSLNSENIMRWPSMRRNQREDMRMIPQVSSINLKEVRQNSSSKGPQFDYS